MDQIALAKPKDMAEFVEKAADHIEMEKLRDAKRPKGRTQKTPPRIRRARIPTERAKIETVVARVTVDCYKGRWASFKRRSAFIYKQIDSLSGDYCILIQTKDEYL
ncbi:hypothetical protein Cni_G16535 [Canna indica]|uniref:Uncharacterized protein n=1 Tax=Canna indica TaxID=4628 RepID=A0AAQ3QFR3_9LILI|nr:hypothetical protein Cni_G16535 [Canna indica]